MARKTADQEQEQGQEQETESQTSTIDTSAFADVPVTDIQARLAAAREKQAQLKAQAAETTGEAKALRAALREKKGNVGGSTRSTAPSKYGVYSAARPVRDLMSQGKDFATAFAEYIASLQPLVESAINLAAGGSDLDSAAGVVTGRNKSDSNGAHADA